MNTVLKSLVKSSILIVGLLTPLAGNAGTAVAVGSTLYINGTVDENMYNEWVLEFSPSRIKNVVLESPGGSVYWGRRIAEDIYANRATVYTEAKGQCTSMCAIMWLSADNHWFNENQEIGFHFSYNDNAAALKDSLFMDGMEYMLVRQKYQTTNDFIDDFKYIGNKNEFGTYMEGMVEHGLWPHSMWYPKVKELRIFEGGIHYK